MKKAVRKQAMRHGNKGVRVFMMCLVMASMLATLLLSASPVKAVTTVHDVNAKWVKVTDSQEISNDGLITTETSTVRMQIGFSTSGNDPIEPEELKITIPRDVFKMHGDNHATLEYPWQTNGDYTVTESEDGKSLIITNKIRLNAATQQSMDITYNVGSGTKVWGNIENEPFKIRVELPGAPPVESTELRTKFVNHTEIKHAQKSLSTLYQTWQDGWDATYKPDNAEDYWYGVWRISTGTTNKTFGETGASNQAIKMWIEDNQDDGEIVGYSALSEGGYPAGLAEMFGSIEEVGDRNDTEDGYAAPLQNYEVSVVIKYPKTMFQSENPVTIENSFTVHLKNDSDEWQEKTTTGTYTFENIQWYDGTPFGLGTATQKHGIKWVYGGVTMLDNATTPGLLDFRLSAEAFNATQMENDTGKYALLGDEFKMVMNDDLLYIPLNSGPLRLTEGDYEAAGFTTRFTARTIAANFTTGKWGLTDVDYAHLDSLRRNPEVTISGYRNGAWEKIATAIHDPESGSITYNWYDGSLGAPDGTNHFTLNEGTRFTRLQWSLVANQGVTEPVSSADPDFKPEDYVLYVDMGNYANHGQFFRQNWKEYNAVADSHGCAYEVRLLPDGENVKKALEEYHGGGVVADDNYGPNGKEVTGPNGEEKPLYVDNVSSYFFTKGAEVLGTNDVGTSVVNDDYYKGDVFNWDKSTYDTDPEKVSFMGQPDGTTSNSGDGSYIMHRIGRNYLTEIEMGSGMGKSVSTYSGGDFGNRYRGVQNDPDNKRVMVPWVISASSWFAGEPEGLQNLQEAGLFELLNDGVVYDLLPLGMTLEDSSVIVRVPGDSSIEPRSLIRNEEFFIEHVPNYKDSGQELIIIRYKYDSPKTSYNTSNGHVTSNIQIFMRTYYSWDAIYDYGDTFHNLAAFETNGSFLPDGEYSIPTTEKLTEEEKVLLGGLDPSYTEVDGETPGKFHYTRSEDVTITELTQARYGLSKLILGPESPAWGTGRVDEKNNQIEIPTGGYYQYRLRYAPSEGTSLRDMILYDALEMYDPDLDTPEALAERNNTKGTPSDTEDVGTVRWKGRLLSIDVTQPKNAIGVAPDVYVTCTEGFIVDEKAAEDNEGKVPTYHDNKNLDVSNPEGSDTEWVKLTVDPHTNVATVPEEMLGKVTGIAIDMRKKGNEEFILQNRQSVAVILNMQGPTDPAEVRRLVNDAAALADNEGNTAATRPYTYNGVSMNSILKHSNGTEDPGAVITNYYTRLTLRIPSGSIEVTKNVKGVEDPSAYEFTFQAKGTEIDGSELLFSGTYYIYDIATGCYVDADGGLVNAEGYPVDAEGNVGSEKADPATYTHTTADGTFKIKGNQRARLIDAVGDIEWTVTEIAGNDGFATTNSVNGGESKDGTASNAFVIGDKQQARVVFNNTAIGEMRITKTVVSGEKERDFEFTVTLTRADGTPYEGDLSYTGEGGKADGVLTFAGGTATLLLKDGESVYAQLDTGMTYDVTETVLEGYEEPAKENDYGTIVFGEPAEVRFENKLVPGEGPDKKVNGQKEVELETPIETFVYEITQKIPADTKKIVVTDELEPVLTLDGEVTVTNADDGSSVEALIETPEADGRTTVTITIDGEAAIALRNKQLLVRFGAVIKDGADLAPYATTGEVKIPNTAGVSINGGPKLETEPVTVTPPGEEEKIDKKVNGKTQEDLETPIDTFTYDISCYIPADAAKIVIRDTLEEVLEFAGNSSDVSVVYGDLEIEGAEIEINANTVTVTIEDQGEDLYATRQRTRTIHVIFEARIKEGADLSAYAETGKVQIPNKASYAINDRPEMESEPVTVTPPEEEEKIDKDVNEANEYTLETPEETFTYTLKAYVPEDAVKIVITDTLEDVLQVVGGTENIAVTQPDGTLVDGAVVAIDGQTIKVTVEDAEDEKPATALRTRYIVVRFDAQIREGADLTPYVVKDTIEVPNTATYTINDTRSHDSEPVKVTPPTPEVPDLFKTVNEGDEAELKSRDEAFTYRIRTTMPEYVESFVITDELVDALQFTDKAVTVTIGGKALSAAEIAAQVEKNGQLLAVSFTEEQLKRKGEAIVVSFEAEIKKNADLSAYEVNGALEIPNTANYELANSAGESQKTSSNKVKIKVPKEKPKKIKSVPVASARTGDPNNLPLPAGLFGAALLGALFLGTRRRRSR